MDRRCDQFPNCGDFSDEEFRLFQFSNIDRFTEYHSGQLPAGGEGQQLHPRLRTLRGGQAGEVDQDGTSNPAKLSFFYFGLGPLPPPLTPEESSRF